MVERQLRELYPGWRTVRKIGSGNFSTVYEIERNLLFGQIEKAALKYISIPRNGSELEEMYSNGYDEASITIHMENRLEKIVREYSLMAEMKGHTNVVYCDDIRYVPKEDGVGWDITIKMELLTPLLQNLKTDFEEVQVIRLGMDICQALMLCREHNIVHRDIKPQNIFVSKSGNYKLGDFGIAKTQKRNCEGTQTGTYSYMAPEVYHNKPYGSSADIYSLGLVMYWLLNERRLPFLPLPPNVPTSIENEEAKTRRLMGELIPSPKNGSAELKAIVLKACAYDPQDRYSSAQEMFEALSHLDIQEDEKTISVVPVSRSPEESVVVPDEEKQIPDPQPNTPSDEDSSQGDQPKKKVVPLFGVVAGVVICAIICSLLMLSRTTVAWRTPSAEDLENYLVDGYSAIGCYEVSTKIPLSKKTQVEFEVGEAYNACIILISGETQNVPVAAIVSDGIATANLEANGTYLLQIKTESSDN